MLCENGCGESATYITKKIKHICNKNAAKCKAINPKGKKKTVRRQAQLYTGGLLCEFCNVHSATHVLVNGKRCCSSTAGNCKEKRKNARTKISKSRNQIDSATGLRNSKLIALKGSKTKSNSIDEFGLNAHQRNGKKVAKIKSENVDENGLTVHQQTGLKYKKWLLTPKGQARLSELSVQQKKIQNNIDKNTGLKEAKRRALKMVETKINNINDLGLNGFEQSHWKAGKNTGFINGIFWQYGNEKRFLEKAIADGIIDKVKRGPVISYRYNNEEKRYMPDYIIENTVYEIKSTYTMFGPNNQYLQKNVAKLLATKESGYEVYVVIDDKTISLTVFLDSVSDLLK